MSIVFNSGLCTKGQLYGVILNLLRGAGWTTINRTIGGNRQAADRDVLRSTGEDGTKNLILHFRPFWNTNNFANTNSITGAHNGLRDGSLPAIPANTNVTNTNANLASIRLLRSFVAGHVQAHSAVASTWSTNSTFNRHGEPLLQFALAPDILAIDAIIEYKYAVNRDRLILVLFYPPWTHFRPIVHYIGVPDNVFLDVVRNNELLYASSFMQSITVDDVNHAWIINAPDRWPETTASERNFAYNLLPSTNPNAASKHMVSRAYYGTNLYGIRGEFAGLFLTKNENINSKELIQMDDGKTLEVAVCHEMEGYTNSFGSAAICYEIDRHEESIQLLDARIDLERNRLLSLNASTLKLSESGEASEISESEEGLQDDDC